MADSERKRAGGRKRDNTGDEWLEGPTEDYEHEGREEMGGGGTNRTAISRLLDRLSDMIVSVQC